MRTITLADIRALKPKPCYDPATKVPETWTGTVVDILRLEHVPRGDRLWVAWRLLSDQTLRLFAVWCAREALKLVPNPDPRSVEACDVAEKFADGLATRAELIPARDGAADAYAAAAYADAYAAACDVGGAGGAARTAQIEHLIRMIEEGAE